MSRPRTLVRSAAASVAALALALVGLPTAHAATGGHVALGDSYSSGLGTGSYYADGTDCRRSPQAYGVLLAERAGLELTLAACSGATTASVATEQLSALTDDTARVTITVGGNDVGFAPVLTECAKPGWWGDCDGAIDEALQIATQQLPGRLGSLFDQIRSRSPQAVVVVSGYPQLFNGEDCHALTFFSGSEMGRLNSAATQLNSVIRQQAVAAGFRYVDAVPTFEGHAVCDDAEWVNNLSVPVDESFHPNVAGHRGYAEVFGSGFPTGTTARHDTTTTPTLPYAVGRSERVTPPDLRSDQARAAAREAGISQQELTAMARAQERGASNARLEAMSRQAVSG